MNLLDLDARWRRFNDEDRACPCCGRQFNGVFDIGFDHPDAWSHGPLPEGEAELAVGEDKLGTDLCRIGDDRFIRCLLSLPIQGSDEVFHFGIWALVPAPAFYSYLDACFGEGTFDGCEALTANALPSFDEGAALAATLVPGPDGQRPRLLVSDGPLSEAQDKGISFDHLLDIYAASGADIRPHLAG
ncbi:MAG: hypothetical protein CML68_16930 [Rhodobacteraceae bacterium]|nr:hypothetical protein [Paracoccaceae bacterium]